MNIKEEVRRIKYAALFAFSALQIFRHSLLLGRLRNYPDAFR